jgi:hypothetical protein
MASIHVISMKEVVENVMKGKAPDNLYEVLNCTPRSTMDQIHAEYKRLVMECHPDRHPGDAAAAERFKKVVHAYEILSDPDKKKNYDKYLDTGLLIPYEVWCLQQDDSHPSAHWRGTLREPERLAPPNSSIDVRGRKDLRGLSSSELLEKFRNYEI